ncbi:hypothetical protein [Streptomyces sp. NPDC006527]|uniref:hypothetical protein n=1 Tax=Streptomyces sp. NPDC006527 TaxID=3364749 RepID=UPI0036B6412F
MLRASTTEVAMLAFLGQLPNAVALWAGALADGHPKPPWLMHRTWWRPARW